MGTKNILLTTLGPLEGDRLQHRYFYYDDGKERTYCDSIIVPEAGAKYILSKELIDEIIVLGSGATCEVGDQMRPLPLAERKDYETIDITTMSEYGFFRYRMSQYMEGYDLEGLDVLEGIDPEREQQLVSLFREVGTELKKDTSGGYTANSEFHAITSNQGTFDHIKDLIDDSEEAEDVRWLRRYAYTKLDRTRKMRMLDANKNVKVCFIPTERGDQGKLDNISVIMDAISSSDADEVNLYMDMQGISSSDGFTLISLLMLLNDDASSHLHVQQLITTNYYPERFASPIDNNEMKRYSLNTLVSGVNAFVQYGKVDLINEYWKNTGIKNEHIEHLLFGMRCIDDGISLCHIGSLVHGINVLKEVFNQPKDESMLELESSIFYILEKSIRTDYGALLEGDELDILAMLQWSYRKRFYQQAMTIIESRIPEELVKKGILYYAKDEETRMKWLDTLQKEYVDTVDSQRWSFFDIDHYFMKYYGLHKVNFRQSVEQRASDFGKLRAGILDADKAEEVGLQQSYSLIADKPELLVELIRCYYLIGPMRNKINHAEDNRGLAEMVSENKEENPIITQLKTALNEFVTVYSKILKYTNEKVAAGAVNDSICVSGAEFKEYSIAHKYDYPDKYRKGGYRHDRNKKNDDRKDNQGGQGNQNNQGGQDGQNRQDGQSNQNGQQGQSGQQGQGGQSGQHGQGGQNRSGEKRYDNRNYNKPYGGRRNDQTRSIDVGPGEDIHIHIHMHNR